MGDGERKSEPEGLSPAELSPAGRCSPEGRSREGSGDEAPDVDLLFVLGVGFLKAGKLQAARKALERSCSCCKGGGALQGARRDYSAALFHLGECCSRLGDGEAAVGFFEESWKESGFLREEAAIDAAAVWIKLGNPARAAHLCREALKLSDSPAMAMHNLNTAMRMMGQLHEAVELSWARIAERWPAQPLPRSLSSSPLLLSDCNLEEGENEVVVILCIKWGSKYGPEYVNRLQRGVSSHLSVNHAFICLTEDPSGLDPNVRHRSFPDILRELSWKGWWHKACLFDPLLASSFPPRTRFFYVDLDSVVTGSLDALVGFSGRFGALSPSGMKNEQRHCGINSSVLSWEAGDPFCEQVFTLLTGENSMRAVLDCTLKFDHWLEMVIGDNVTFLQEAYPDQVCEFSASAAKNPSDKGSPLPPAGARLVVFPLRPKPHELVVEEAEKEEKEEHRDKESAGKDVFEKPAWVRDYWLR